MFSVIPTFAFLFIYWIDFFSAVSVTRVEVTTPIHSVTVGGILAVQCQVWNIEDGYKVMIVRIVDGVSEQITTGDAIIPSSVSERVFLSKRPFPGGSSVYFLTMLEVSLLDHGVYGCTVSRLSGLSSVQIAQQDSVTIQINEFPDKTQPMCSSNPTNLVMIEGSRLELTCTSYKTIPVVDLKWRLMSSYQYLPISNSTKNNKLYSKSNVETTMTHHGAVFKCEMTSRGFPDRVQSCQIGPISVIASRVNSGTEIDSVTSHPNAPVIKTETANDLLLSGDCDNTCQSSSFSIFILTISTIATCLLTIVFLITTIVMCCKYHNISSEVNRESRQQYIPSRASDPVYVSLQRRHDNEQVYMTLEDPNNPEGKVLLPKEVFDQFYNRTMSLRKT